MIFSIPAFPPRTVARTGYCESRLAHELVMVYDASDAVLLFRFVLARTLVYFRSYHPAFTYHFHITIRAHDLARQNDVELDLRSDLQFRICLYEHASAAHIRSRRRARLAGFPILERDRQCQRKPLACARV